MTDARPPVTQDVVITWDVRKRCWVVRETDWIKLDGASGLLIYDGYETDLASIPRPLQLVIDEQELSIVAPVVHDVLYQTKGRPDPETTSPRGKVWTRKQADQTFLWLMKAEGVSWWKRRAAYHAVRAFGWMAWSRRG